MTMTKTADVVCLSKTPIDKKWLRFLEEDEGRFLVVLTEEKGPLPHERVRYVSPGDEQALKKVCWELVFLTFDYEPASDPAFEKLKYLQKGIHLVASSYQERGLDLLSNFMQNAPHLERAKCGASFFGSFQNVPAIICGAGPSLEVAAPYLRTLKEKALFFGGGSSLGTLQKMGLTPHFGAMIDPYPPEERLKQITPFETPTFFQTRAHPKMVEKGEGPLLWMGGSSLDLFDEEKFDGGWNVSTFLTAIACHLGCDPIILVGVDLAQTKERAYAGGLERSEGGELIEVGDGLYSRPDWILAAEWLNSFAKKHPEVSWYSASNGLELKGFSKTPIHTLSFEEEADLQGLVHSILQKEGPAANVLDPKKLRESLSRTSSIIGQLLRLIESLFPNPFEKDGEYIQLKLELDRELAYSRFVSPIWEVWKHVFARNMVGEPTVGLELNKWLFIKGICDDAREI